MRIVRIIFVVAFMLGLAGCRTSRQISREYQSGSHTEQTVLVRDSIRYVHDTITTTEYRTIESQEESLTTSEIQEWWDNWTKTFIDSTGNTVVEVHETGNRNSNTAAWSSYISKLQDSLMQCRSQMEYYRMLDSLSNTVADDSVKASESKVTTVNKASFWSTFSNVFYVCLFALALLAGYKLYTTIKSK